MEIRKSYGGFDVFKLIAAFLVVAIHTSPLTSVSPAADFFFTRILGRLAVPFFFMVTGQFILTRYIEDGRNGFAAVWKYIKKVMLLYLAAIIIYLPIGYYAGNYSGVSPLSALCMLIFDGTFYHLWYFPALIVGILFVCLLRRVCPVRGLWAITVVLYIIGLLGDSYWGITENVPVVSGVYEAMFKISSYTRNGLFFAPVFLLMGSQAAKLKISVKKSGILFAAAFILMTAEGLVLRHFNLQRHDSMYIMLPVCMVFLYQLIMSWERGPAKILRTASTWIYILHPAVIIAVRGAASVLGLRRLLVENSVVHYLAVCIGSFVIAVIITYLLSRFRRKSFREDRAWIEVDRAALARNVAVLRALLPESCELMPAVKANAYGHGMTMVARELNELGVRAFCVASVSEGVELRRSGIVGEVLILGYTHPAKFPLLKKYDLSQTVVDPDYAVELERYGKKIAVHIGIDTGMHRLGTAFCDLEAIEKIFKMKNLRVRGIFTHMCTADGGDEKSVEFSRRQGETFLKTVEELKSRGLDCGKIHMLPSYGILNYPEYAGDYARVGIALYGVKSAREDYDASGAELMPVMSMKARVASVRELKAGESAGYGLAFTAERDSKIATVTIGYADGYPRGLSCGKGHVLINGQIAPVAGRICMDQTIVDVTDIDSVHSGDIAVIIGRSGDKEISAYDIAEQTGTITNEIFSRLGSRLQRFMV